MDGLVLLALFLAIVPIAALHWLFSGRRRLNRLQDRVKKIDFAFARQEDKVTKLKKRVKALEAQLKGGIDASAVAVTPAEAPAPAAEPEAASAAAAPIAPQAVEAPSPGPEAGSDVSTVPETPVEIPSPAEAPKPAPSVPAPVPLRVAEAPSSRPEADAERPATPKPEDAPPRPVEPVTLPRETRARPAPARRASRWSRLIQSLQAAARSERLKEWESGVGKDDQRPAKKEPWPTILPEATAEAATARVEAAEWESRIGRRWLNVIGIVVLVVGIVLLIGYSLRYLGPPGRITIGFATGAALLLGGWWLEKLERYHVFGLGPIGGGWALLYFTAYAAHNVEAARIIDNPVWALPLMVGVAAGMIAHSFRYTSQIVTGLAYGLAYFAVALSPLTTFSLIASSLLGASLVALLRVVPWYHLGMAGVAGTYLSFFLWLEGPASAQAGLVASEAFRISIAILAFYWVLFAAAAFVRRPASQPERMAVFALSAANSVGFFSLAIWLMRVVYPSDLYVLTLLGGFAYVVLAYMLRVVRLHATFVLNALVAVALFAFTGPLAIPRFSLSWEWLALPWVTEATVVLWFGFRLREIWLRLASYLLCGLTLAALAAYNLHASPDDRLLVSWLTVPLVILFFFYLFEKLQRAAGKDDVRTEARELGLIFGYAATALLAAFLWQEISRAYIAIAWLAAGLGFIECGVRTVRPHVRIQGYLLCGLALAGFLVINLYDPGGIRAGASLRTWALVGAGVALYYLSYARLQRPFQSGRLWAAEGACVNALSYAGAFLLAVLLGRQLEHDVVGLAWMLVGVASFEAGVRWLRMHLRWQAYGFVALSVGVLLLLNLYGVVPLLEGADPWRWPTVGVAVPLLYYLYGRLEWLRQGDKVIITPERNGAALPSYAATALLAVLCWVELNAVSVAVAWAFLALILYQVGVWKQQPALRLQAHAMAVLAFGRLFLANFVAYGETAGLSHRLLSVIPVAAVLYYLRFALGEERGEAGAAKLSQRMRWLYSYGAAILLVVLARFEFGRGGAVVAWAPLALIFLVLGTRFQDRDFRIQSYVLAALTFARSWGTNLVLAGSFYGIPERIATTSVAVAAFFGATLYCLSKRETFAGLAGGDNVFHRIDVNARVLFSFLATVLLAVLLAYEVERDWLTVAWALEAFAVLGLGFLVVERSFRIYGLVLLLLCLLKLVALDMQGVETLYRILSFIIVGLILLLVSFGYTRYQEVVKRYL